MGDSRRRWATEFERHAVASVRSSGRPIRAVARELGCFAWSALRTGLARDGAVNSCTAGRSGVVVEVDDAADADDLDDAPKRWPRVEHDDRGHARRDLGLPGRGRRCRSSP